MKKLQISLMMVLMLLATVPISAANAPVNNIPTPAEAAKVSELLTRLDEIKALDKSTMNSLEKRNSEKK